MIDKANNVYGTTVINTRCVSHVGLTGNPDSRALIYQCPKIIHSLFCLCMDIEKTIAKEALLAIVNISAEEEGAAILLKEVRVIMCKSSSVF